MGIPLSLDPNKQPHQLYDDIDYREFWTGWQQAKLDQAEHTIVRKLLPTSGHRLIDIGCGYGRLSDCYLDRFRQVVLYDGSLSLLQRAREKIDDRAIYVAGDLYHLPFRAGAFDSLLMVRVFHHVSDAHACMSELKRVSANRGTLVLTYRNKLYGIAILKWLADRRTDSPFSIEPSGLDSTLISHHPKYIRQLLLQHKFSHTVSRGLGILDRLALKAGRFGKYAPTGSFLAPVFGKLMLAPWVFCKSVAAAGAPLLADDGLDEILICIRCGGALTRETSGYTCQACQRNYPLVDGILDFRDR